MASASKYPTVQAVKTLHKTGEWANYFKEGDPATLEKDYIKVEEELAKGKLSVRKQVEEAKAFVHKFASDLEIRHTAADASSELLALWEELKHAYQAEYNAGEKVQDCLDKYPKTSELIRQTKQSMDAKVNFPALFERLIMVTKLDTERKEIQKVADEAKAIRLAAEKLCLRSLQALDDVSNSLQKLTVTGATLDPSYVPAPTRARACY